MSTSGESAAPPQLELLLRGEPAHAVLRALVRDLTAQTTNGKAVPPWAQPVCEALARAAEVPAPDMSATGHAFGSVLGMGSSPGLVPVSEAARLVGRGERHVRRLAASGRVVHQRVGERTLLVDVESLRNVLGRTA